MASSKLSLLLAILSVCALVDGASHHHAAPAPAPTSVDCTSLVLNMADCLSFVSNDSTTTKPEAGCCAGLKTVLNTNADCLCEAFKSSAQFGIVLNVTKAVTLPAACKIHASPASNCGLALPTGGAPALAPAAATSNSGIVLTPAPSPGSSGSSHGLSVSVGSLVIGLALASFSSI